MNKFIITAICFLLLSACQANTKDSTDNTLIELKSTAVKQEPKQDDSAKMSDLDYIKSLLKEKVAKKESIAFAKPIFKFTEEFESDDRPIQQTVKVYQQNNVCIAEALYLSDSGFGGTSDVAVFLGDKILYGFQRDVYQQYQKADTPSGIKFTGKINYDAEIKNDPETQTWLQESLLRWHKQYFTNTVKQSCIRSDLKTTSAPHQSIASFYGSYQYDNYQTDERLGTGVGAFYQIYLSKKACTIDIEGYQVDSHFKCEAKPAQDKDAIVIYNAENQEVFGTIYRTQDNQYAIDMSYYTKYEGSTEHYELEKVK